MQSTLKRSHQAHGTRRAQGTAQPRSPDMGGGRKKSILRDDDWHEYYRLKLLDKD